MMRVKRMPGTCNGIDIGDRVHLPGARQYAHVVAIDPEGNTAAARKYERFGFRRTVLLDKPLKGFFRYELSEVERA